MIEPNAEFNNTQQTKPEHSLRLKGLEALEKSRLLYKKPTVEGKENLPLGPCVVATTHLSGYDVSEVVAEMMKSRKTGRMQSSTFRPFWNMMGIENVFTISSKSSSSFNTEIIEQMKDAINKDGVTLVIAAHNPTKDWKLPDKPGLAAVILAHSAKVPLVPVALDIQSKTPLKKLKRLDIIAKHLILGKKVDTKMIIGNPISFPGISDDRLQLAINLYSPDKRRAMTEEQVKEAQATLNVLKSEAGEVMRVLASSLSEEKRGKWG